MFVFWLSMIVFLLAFAWVIYPLVAEAFATPGTLWDKLMAAGDGSMTVLHGRVSVLVAASIGLVSSAAEIVGMTDVRAWLQSWLSPETFSGVVGLVGVLTVLARLRTLER